MVHVANLITAAIGVMLIVGAYRRWRWLVDPPTDLAPYYSQALLKRILGVRGVVVFTYLLGFTFVALSLYGFLRVLSRRA